MCGIAGIAGHLDPASTRPAVASMTASLARRGPDGSGLECWDGAILGHRRLAIFDLSDAGRQPMTSPDRSIAVVFNGAIYNFHELRTELAAKGYSFRSDTDTEVLVHGYHAWGIDELLPRLRGMFAIALWDERQGKLYLVRDRLGVKPLLYTVRNGCLAFASTAAALREAGFAGEIDTQAVVEFLEFGYVTDARSIYSGVSKVAAGEVIEWSGGALRKRSYWSPPAAGTAGRISFEDAVVETERLLLQAVSRRLFADVPVGALLSGGVDSSLICWAIRELGGNITAFTVATPGDPMDESEDARATASALGLRHEILAASAGDSPGIAELVAAYSEPFACASALGMLKVSEAVKRQATVLLTGDGGDDVFLGYPEHLHFFRAQQLASLIPAPAARAWYALRPLIPRKGILRRAAHFLDFSTAGLGGVTRAHDGLPFYRAHGILGERLAGAEIPERQIPRSPAAARRLMADFLDYDRRMRFTGEYMTKVDGATMHHALEARSPFLDQDLWSFAASLPYGMRLRGGRLKAVLRALARRKVGERVSAGKKRGFGIPVQRWIAGQWRDRVAETLGHSWLAREGWIDSRAALRALEASTARRWAPVQLWYLFVLGEWVRLRHEGAASRPLAQAR